MPPPSFGSTGSSGTTQQPHKLRATIVKLRWLVFAACVFFLLLDRRYTQHRGGDAAADELVRGGVLGCGLRELVVRRLRLVVMQDAASLRTTPSRGCVLASSYEKHFLAVNGSDSS